MLEKEIKIRHCKLNNRLVMAPVALEKSDKGKVSNKLLAHYEERARGGCIGLVISEHTFVREDGRASRNQLSTAKDNDIAGLTMLADVIHKRGSKAVVQISHAGAAITSKVVTCEGISPSGIANPNGALGGRELQATHAMSVEEIHEIVKAFAQAAVRVKKAGFDGVEIHSAHGYLLNQFYSPLTNHRRDEYNGNTIPGRTKIHQEIIKSVRKAVGSDLLIGIRLGACDYMPGGSTVEDGVKAAEIFEAVGADFIDVSGGMCFFTRPGHKEPGYFGDASAAIKRSVSIPVILAGGVKTRVDAEKLLLEDKADLIASGREIMKDALWADRLFQ